MIKDTDSYLSLSNEKYIIYFYKSNSNVIVTKIGDHERIECHGRMSYSFMESIINILHFRSKDVEKNEDFTIALDSDEDLCDGNVYTRLVMHLEPNPYS